MPENMFPYALICILVSGAATFLTRLLPFVIFGRGAGMPPKLKKMADILPSAIIATLVIYGISTQLTTLNTTTLAAVGALAITVALHLYKSNTLLSMFAGTASYMLFVYLIG